MTTTCDQSTLAEANSAVFHSRDERMLRFHVDGAPRDGWFDDIEKAIREGSATGRLRHLMVTIGPRTAVNDVDWMLAILGLLHHPVSDEWVGGRLVQSVFALRPPPSAQACGTDDQRRHGDAGAPVTREGEAPAEPRRTAKSPHPQG